MDQSNKTGGRKCGDDIRKMIKSLGRDSEKTFDLGVQLQGFQPSQDASTIPDYYKIFSPENNVNSHSALYPSVNTPVPMRNIETVRNYQSEGPQHQTNEYLKQPVIDQSNKTDGRKCGDDIRKMIKSLGRDSEKTFDLGVQLQGFQPSQDASTIPDYYKIFSPENNVNSHSALYPSVNTPVPMRNIETVRNYQSEGPQHQTNEYLKQPVIDQSNKTDGRKCGDDIRKMIKSLGRDSEKTFDLGVQLQGFQPSQDASTIPDYYKIFSPENNVNSYSALYPSVNTPVPMRNIETVRNYQSEGPQHQTNEYLMQPVMDLSNKNEERKCEDEIRTVHETLSWDSGRRFDLGVQVQNFKPPQDESTISDHYQIFNPAINRNNYSALYPSGNMPVPAPNLETVRNYQYGRPQSHSNDHFEPNFRNETFSQQGTMGARYSQQETMGARYSQQETMWARYSQQETMGARYSQQGDTALYAAGPSNNFAMEKMKQPPEYRAQTNSQLGSDVEYYYLPDGRIVPIVPPAPVAYSVPWMGQNRNNDFYNNSLTNTVMNQQESINRNQYLAPYSNPLLNYREENINDVNKQYKPPKRNPFRYNPY